MADLTQRQYQQLERGKADPLWFRQHYFPHLYDEPLGEGHRRLAALRAAHPLLVEAAFRGWGKSTDETYAETVRALAVGESQFSVLTSKTDGQTYPLVIQARVEFEMNARLIQDYGDQAGGSLWRRDHFALRSGAECRGRSLSSGLRGLRSLRNRRPDRWILDDIQDDADARNPQII